ncbi:MAG: glycosyltransferase family 4 protein [Candidatus Omnitrophota bacterium]
MKILLLTTHLNYGGISSYTVALGRALAEAGHEVFCASSSGDMLAQVKANNVKHIHIPIRTKAELNPLVIFSLIKLLLFIRKNPVDVIHAQTRVTQVLSFYLNRITKIPYVTTCHGFFKRNIGRQFFPCWGNKVIAISEAVARHLQIDFYVDARKIALIPNAIDVTKFKISDKRNDPNHKDRVVGVIARLSKIKGHKYLIEAMAQVIEEYPDARLYIFGQGKIKYQLVELTKKLNIHEQVFFLPPVSDPGTVLKDIDIFVMPSLQEGLGLSILEAQASGLAVIASNVGGIPTIVKHDITGLLVPPCDSIALAGAIMRIMDNKDLAIRLGIVAARNVAAEFDLKIMVKKVESVYTEVTKK